MAKEKAPIVPPAYPYEIPALEAPPQPTMVVCTCNAAVVTRIWHNRTETMPAHWELCQPLRTPVLEEPHTQEDCKRRKAAKHNA